MMTRTVAFTAFLAPLVLAGACGGTPVEVVETTAAVPVTVEAARTETLNSLLVVTGTVVPAPGAEWTITAPDAGRIVDLPKAAGDVVAEGDLLVRFDIPSLAADLAARRADVTQATARVETTKAALTRASGLFDQGIAARREVEEARQAQADAEAALAQAKGAVEAATSLAARAEVRARFAGVVAQRWHNPGDLVDASASDPILKIINPRQLQVVAAVPIADIPRVVPGHAAVVKGPGGADEQARVLTRPPEVDPSSATADVRIAFTGTTRLASGTTVEVDITADSRPNALVVPMAAVVRDGDHAYIFVAGPDNKAHRHEVTTGLAARDLVEITSGLSAGDRVIVQGQDGLPDGAAITVAK